MRKLLSMDAMHINSICWQKFCIQKNWSIKSLELLSVFEMAFAMLLATKYCLQ